MVNNIYVKKIDHFLNKNIEARIRGPQPTCPEYANPLVVPSIHT